jgi:hypothetical protein
LWTYIKAISTLIRLVFGELSSFLGCVGRFWEKGDYFLWFGQDGCMAGNIWQFLGLLFVPIFEVIVSYSIELFEGPLFIKTVCTHVEPVYMSKDAFKFPDFFFSDIVPDFIDRKMCP